MATDLVRNNTIQEEIFTCSPYNSGELSLKQDAYSGLNKLIWRDWRTYKKKSPKALDKMVRSEKLS